MCCLFLSQNFSEDVVMHHSDVEDVKARGNDLVEVQPQLTPQIGRTTGKIVWC